MIIQEYIVTLEEKSIFVKLNSLLGWYLTRMIYIKKELYIIKMQYLK